MPDKRDERRTTSARLSNPSPRGFTLDRFEQEVANEIGIGRDRLPEAGRQGAVGQGAARGQSAARGATNPPTGGTAARPDDERK